MEKINCSECKIKCEQRVEGSLCVKNKEIEGLIKIYETRDPVLISRHLVEVLGSEMSRYWKAVKNEKIGETITKQVITKGGDVVDVEVEGTPNPVITDMAKSLIKSGKTISDIINPPKTAPYIQNNTQVNFGSAIANEISALPDGQQQDIIKFIDEKLNA